MTSKVFTPTYLYVKRHSVTGKLYFGKTTQNPEVYLGSGLKWKRHRKKHGVKEVETLWYCLFTEEVELKLFSLMYQEIFDICNSDSGYINLKPENGMDGAPNGYASYKNRNGDIFYIQNTDPRIEAEGLVGEKTGFKMSTVQKDKMRRAKDDYRKITLYFMTYERTLNLTDPEFATLIDYGWTPYMQQERYEQKKELAKQGAQKAMTGKNRFYHRDGTYYGMLSNDDPLVAELDLVHIRSEKQKSQAAEQLKKNAQNKEMQARKGRTLSTRKWFHDPVTNENRRLVECPDGWKVGRSEQGESNKGKETWNDGIKNYMLRPGEVPDPAWVRGMAPRKKK